jgi:hypothetical protein
MSYLVTVREIDCEQFVPHELSPVLIIEKSDEDIVVSVAWKKLEIIGSDAFYPLSLSEIGFDTDFVYKILYLRWTEVGNPIHFNLSGKGKKGALWEVYKDYESACIEELLHMIRSAKVSEKEWDDKKFFNVYLEWSHGYVKKVASSIFSDDETYKVAEAAKAEYWRSIDV